MSKLFRLLSVTVLAIVFPTLIFSVNLHVVSAEETSQSAVSKSSVKSDKKESKKETDNPYVRVVRNKKKKTGSLDTSIRHFVGENGVTVDLVGAIHVAEKSYYEQLNDIFKDYDVVLYEVVAEEGTRPGANDEDDDDSGSVSIIGFAQQKFADLLGLVHQIDYIDYQAENMVHADMSPKEFSEAMKARNDGFFAWYLRQMGYEMAKEDSDSNTDDTKIFLAFFKKNRKKALKDALADQFAQMDCEAAMNGGTDGTSIITDRNNKVLGKLKEILKDGSKKKIAIFYGAAHLPDFAQKLEKDFHMKPQDDQIRWVKAWKF